MLKNYSMSIIHHPCKANILVDAISRLSMRATAHVKEENKELDKDIHILTHLGDGLMYSIEGGIMVTNESKSSLVSKVKENEDQNPILPEMKANVHNERILAFEQRGDSVLKY